MAAVEVVLEVVEIRALDGTRGSLNDSNELAVEDLWIRSSSGKREICIIEKINSMKIRITTKDALKIIIKYK